ncbi:Cl- channel, voltage-gated family protein [Psychromonas ingrahamii 37]|uniref:Cl-channel, voltage-gated family protein n=1 Tax=Psychromonas ingrahamii (strain DSM 17664 / CCUG 51855 / 37) TaxID=357804 RepID=A1ST93_PSYIN|nr:H(+)/Cl(-) exchange transporter ClcA [Psychromonas ingrahamii]ABM02708.1 Cl- channel, voltage-gated family protein [Psychromonas ingrahamii 37]
MNKKTPTSSVSIPKRFITHFFTRKSSALLIWLSAIIGILAGAMSALFDHGIIWISELRLQLIASFGDSDIPLWIVAIPISSFMAGLAFYLTHRFAPEAGGSGIPEIEGAMEGMRPVRWKRVIPVKFFGGLLALGSGMALGREGPSVQMGGNIGRMISDIFKVDQADAQALLAAGAAGGLAAAFNAPLAGIMFVIEEMRSQFNYSLTSTKSVFMSAVMATIVMRFMSGQDAVISVTHYSHPDLLSLWLYLLLGFCFGVIGLFFNKLLLAAQDMYLFIHKNKRWRFVSVGLFLGAVFGALSVLEPQLAYSGLELIPEIAGGHYLSGALMIIFLFRIVTTLASFGSGAPGGVFAPTLALGTLFGMLFGLACHALFPELVTEPGRFAIAGMGGLFAASVRAPITGILLVIEMTSNYEMILPLIVTCLGATMVAQTLGGRPIYTQLLERTMRISMRQKRQEQARKAMVHLERNQR